MNRPQTPREFFADVLLWIAVAAIGFGVVKGISLMFPPDPHGQVVNSCEYRNVPGEICDRP